IKPGDILVSVNGEEITDTTKLLNVVAQIKPGATAKVHVVRKGKELDVNVMIGKRPPPPKQALDEQDSDTE
ncbi:PDZ domain-containing protein, partial [Burkholderia ubonensis]